MVDADRLVHSMVDNIISMMPSENLSMPHKEEDAVNINIKFCAVMIVTRSYSTGQIFILTERHPGSPTQWTLPMHVYDNKTGSLLNTLNQEIIPRVLEKLPIETRFGPDENLSTGVGAYPLFSILDQCVFFCDYRRLTTAAKDLMEKGDQFRWLTFPMIKMGQGGFRDFDISPLFKMLHAEFALVPNSQPAMKNIRDIRSVLRGRSVWREYIDDGMPLTGTTTIWYELWGAYSEM
jgi:hypothetical protein